MQQLKDAMSRDVKVTRSEPTIPEAGCAQCRRRSSDAVRIVGWRSRKSRDLRAA